MNTEKTEYGFKKLEAIPSTMQPWLDRGMHLVHPKPSKFGEYVLVDCQPAADNKELQHQILVIDETGRPLPGIQIVVAYPTGGPIPVPSQKYWEHGETDLRGVTYRTDGNGRAHHPTGATGGERIWIWDIDSAGDLKLASVKVEGCAVVDTPPYHNKGVFLTFQRRKAEPDTDGGTIQIKGPYWSANAMLLSAPVPGETAQRSLMARLLFVDQDVRPARGETSAFLPGTLLVLCHVRSVDIKPDAGFIYRWARPAGEQPPDVRTTEAIQRAVRAGTAALLVLRGDPDQLARGEAAFDCLNGEISLDGMQPQNDAHNRLYRAVGLATPAGPVPAYAQRRSASVHASGLSLYGRAQFPWEAQLLALPFQVAQVIPTAGRPAFRLTIEADRLTADEERLVIRAWRRLSGYLNPKHPLNQDPVAPEVPTPTWLTLELSNPLAVPRLFGQIAPWKAVNPLTALNVEPAEVNLLLSDQQPYDRVNPAASLARVTPQVIQIQKAGTDLRVTVQAHSANPAGKGSIRYDWARADRQEQFAFKGLEVGFEPVRTANLLREQQGRPAPEWLPDVGQPQPITQSILWGFMPLEDGWAELPFLNLTAQIFLDAGIGPRNPPATVAPSILQGAVAIGNDHEAVLRHYRDEQPWNFTLTDAQDITGTWTLRGVTGGSYELATVSASVTGPEAIFNGLLWLSGAHATAEDALPDPTDWVAGLQSIPLKTVDPAFDLFPPPVLLNLSDFAFALRDVAADDDRRPSAQMAAWSFTFQTNPLAFDPLVAKKVIPDNVFKEPPPAGQTPLLPLLWRRHPTLPMIQALPLTQSKNPPTFPGASRQLVPFQMSARPVKWTFYVAGANAARRWPEFKGDLPPAGEWIGDKGQRSDLPLVALSLPGLVIDPALPEGTGLGKTLGLNLPAQYRFDLPYLDQIMTLAQAPKIPRDPSEVSPLPDEKPPQPPQPLERATYAEYWEKLSEQAGLASADAVEAFLIQAGNESFVEHLVEPYRWPAKPTATVDTYPGSLTLDDPASGARQELSGEMALKGISGHFTLDGGGKLHLSANGSGQDAFAIDAGSMAAYPQEGGFRDQRGLLRRATAHAADGQLLQTPVQLERELNTFDRYLLTSTLTPLDLALTGATTAQRWRFWFRDLPVNAGTSVFDRQDVASGEAKARDLDINDPEALGREYNYRQGYEWRMGIDGQKTAFLDFGGLRFYPLTLESVHLAPSKQVDQVVLIGRLQLPLGADSELTDLSNAVKLSFGRADANAGLRLSAVELISPAGEWPLALTGNNEVADAPFLLWGKIALKQTDATPAAAAELYLEVSDVQLRYFLFDVEWTLPLDEPLVFYLDAGNPEAISRNYAFDYDETAPIYPQEVAVTLALAEPYQHACDFYLNIQLGSRIVDGLAAHYTFRQGIDQALVYDVARGNAPLNLTITTPGGVVWTDAGLVIQQPTGPTALVYNGPAEAFVKELRAARELSVELWLTPNAATAAPILVLNQHGQTGFRLSQSAGQIQARLGAEAPLTGALPGDKQAHVVYTRDVWGQARLYINGQEAAVKASATDFKTWDTSIQLALANEIKGGSPWRGAFHSVSLSQRALTADEVSYRYLLGAGGRALRSAFSAEIKFPLLVAGAAVARDKVKAETQQTALFDDIPIKPVEQAFLQGRSLQFRWDSQPRGNSVLYLLPGLALSPNKAAPGFAVLTFEAGAGFTLDPTLAADLASKTATIRLQQAFAAAGFPLSRQAAVEPVSATAWTIRSGRDGRRRFSVRRLARTSGAVYQVYAGIPALRLTMAFMEAMLTCAWGESLQDPRPASETSPVARKHDQKAIAPPLQAFGSSAGDVLFNYTARLQAGAEAGERPWDETFLLNGMVEVTNLMSWPLAMTQANSQLRLPNLRGAPGLDHLRHTIRILLNQHEIPPGTLVVGEGPLIFNFAGRKAWQFLAVVEHQLIDTYPRYKDTGQVAGWEVTYNRDRRWTALQEVRWASPRAFKAFLDFVDGGDAVNPFSIPAKSPYAYGYFNPGFRKLLNSGALQQLPSDLLLVEASAPHWIKRVPTRSTNTTSVQYLPFGVQAAILSSPDDFKTSRTGQPADGNDWLLLTMPFIGRMQPIERDTTDPQAKPYPLQLDPILELTPFVSAPAGKAAPPLPLALANWADGAEATFTLLDFDTHIGRLFPRLDPLSLEENWFRLQNPLIEPTPPGLRSIAAALPPTPGRLSRSLALRRAVDSFRPAYPPALLEGLPPEEPTDAGFVWRQRSLMMFQASAAPKRADGVPYAWHFIGGQVLQGLPSTASPARQTDPRALLRQRYPAATLIPTPPRLKGAGGDVENRTPVSFAVSPYLGLELLYVGTVDGSLNENANQAGTKAGELLCADAGALRPVASYIWEPKKIERTDGQETIWQDMAWDKWAIETHQRLAADSLVAVLRFRQVFRTGDGAEAPLAIHYSYQLVTEIVLRERLDQRTHRVRSAVRALRFRQGQYGGHALPADLHAFELAAPQTSGLQPVYLTQSPLPEEPWPWGVSGLRVSVQYTQDQHAVLDAVPTQEGETTLWWQVPALAVQFRSAERSERRAASLPQIFRAPAIKSLLPVLPNPPMPKVGQGQLDKVQDIDPAQPAHGRNGWQSVLPGLLRYLVTGSRSGVMFALRNLLIRQKGLKQDGGSVGETVVSGSVPAQHRFPRPVPLPLNSRDRRATALQTWASYFEPEQNALITRAPVDEAFFAAFRPHPEQAGEPVPESPARRFRMILREPAYGALPRDWNGDLTFDVATEQPVPRLRSWQIIEPVVTDATARCPLNPPTFVPLMDLPGQILTEDQPITQPVRDRLETEGILAPGQTARFYRDGQWDVTLNITNDGTINLTVYDEDGGLTVCVTPNAPGVPEFISITDKTQQPDKPIDPPKPQVAAIRNALLNGDALPLASVIREKLSLAGVPNNAVRQQWLIADHPGGQVFALVTPQADTFAIESLRLRFTFKQVDDRKKLSSSGLALSVRVRHWQTTSGFDLTLRFPLTAVDQRRLPLPFEPYYVHFEDPEYNRLLASNAAHAAQIVKDRRLVDGKAQEIAHTVTLAADRKEYDADSEIALRFDWDDDRQDAVATSLNVVRLTPGSGSPTPLLLRDATSEFHAGELRRYSLAELAASAKIALTPGDKIQITVGVKGKDETGEQPVSVPIVIVLELPIIEQPVTPSPQAGYALLRANTLTDGDNTRHWVECARFAWTPEATRVEMVCAEDLRAEVVRRRAVFQWRDTARPNRAVRQAIQKITLMGSTHFPWTR